MIQNLNSLYFIVGLFVLINMEADAQDSRVIKEIQTYYLDGTLKSIEQNKFNADGNITSYSSYDTDDNTIYLHKINYDSLNRPIKEVSISDNKIVDSKIITKPPDIPIKHLYCLLLKNHCIIHTLVHPIV